MNKRKGNKKGTLVIKGLVNLSIGVLISGTIFMGAANGDDNLHNIESEISSSIDRASMFLSMGDTYSAKLILNEDILNRYEEIPESILPGVDNLCKTLNVNR